VQCGNKVIPLKRFPLQSPGSEYASCPAMMALDTCLRITIEFAFDFLLATHLACLFGLHGEMLTISWCSSIKRRPYQWSTSSASKLILDNKCSGRGGWIGAAQTRLEANLVAHASWTSIRPPSVNPVRIDWFCDPEVLRDAPRWRGTRQHIIKIQTSVSSMAGAGQHAEALRIATLLVVVCYYISNNQQETRFLPSQLF
jgi:hypothetical protein